MQAYAAMKFADACLRRLRGYVGIVQCAFVASQVTDLLFFSSKVRLNRTWAEELLPLGPLNEYERSGILINLEIFRCAQMTTKEDGSSFNFGLRLLTCGAGLERAKKELAATKIVSVSPPRSTVSSVMQYRNKQMMDRGSRMS